MAHGFTLLELSAVEGQRPLLVAHRAEPATVRTRLRRFQRLGLLVEQHGQGAFGDLAQDDQPFVGEFHCSDGEGFERVRRRIRSGRGIPVLGVAPHLSAPRQRHRLERVTVARRRLPRSRAQGTASRPSGVWTNVMTSQHILNPRFTRAFASGFGDKS